MDLGRRWGSVAIQLTIKLQWVSAQLCFLPEEAGLLCDTVRIWAAPSLGASLKVSLYFPSDLRVPIARLICVRITAGPPREPSGPPTSWRIICQLPGSAESSPPSPLGHQSQWLGLGWGVWMLPLLWPQKRVPCMLIGKPQAHEKENGAKKSAEMEVRVFNKPPTPHDYKILHSESLKEP